MGTTQIVIAPGTTTQETVGSQTLMITAVKAPAGVWITKPETLAADGTATVAPPAADQPVSSGQFRLGQETDARTVVDITVTRCRWAGWRSAYR